MVISDLHLGNDLTYSENVKHLARLEEFLTEIRFSKTVRELVIAGDMFDEWYIPTRIDAYGGQSQAEFIKKSVKANRGIFQVLNNIIKEREVRVTYIPGNHDMGFFPKNIDLAMPGVNQARDSGNKYGVGTYSPLNYPEICIEHGHRYDFFNAMTLAGTLPPGYFFARIAANSFTDPTTQKEATKVPEVFLNHPEDPEQNSKYLYYTLWRDVLENSIFVKDNFEDPIIKTNVGNYTQDYAIRDILPYNSSTDGSIHMNLFNDIFTQLSWDERERFNNVSVLSNIDQAILGSLDTEFLDNQANIQYFQDPYSKVRVVIFGHTHKPMIKTFTNTKGEECVYANSGTWEDVKSRDNSSGIDQDVFKMDFVIVFPVKSDRKKLYVRLYQYKQGTHTLKDSKTINL